jgi:hypothetical protein
MLFLDVHAKGENGGGRVTSDGGSRANRTDVIRDSNTRRGNQVMRDAFSAMGETRTGRRNRRGMGRNGR